MLQGTLTALCSKSRSPSFERTYSALSRAPTSTKPPHNPLQRDSQQPLLELPRQNSKNNNSCAVALTNFLPRKATPPANPPPLDNPPPPQKNPTPQKNALLKKNFSSEKTTKKINTIQAKNDIFGERKLGVFARGVLGVFRRENGRVLYGDIRRQTSTDSANTISNSSLQDMEETEFTSVDLVNFMGQVNGHLA